MRSLLAVLLLSFPSLSFASELPPLEAYGRLPMMDILELSPDGTRAASRVMRDGRDLVMVIDLESMEFVTGLDAAEVNPRWLRWISEDQLVLVVSDTVRTWSVRNAFDYSQAYSFDVATRDIRVLLKRAPDLYPFQGGLGRIIGRDPANKTVFMPAFTGTRASQPTGGIYAVRLDRGRDKLIAKGNQHTIDWFLDANNKPLVREDFNDKANVHSIWTVSERGRNEKLLYEREGAMPAYGVVGLTPARDALVLLSNSQAAGGVVYYLMSLEDGSIDGPVLAREGADIRNVITDASRVVYGVEYAGFKPSYQFFDAELNERVADLQRRLPDLASELVSWSDDFRRLVFAIQGGWSSGAYLMFEKDVAQPVVIGRFREDIAREHVAPVEIIEYEARDAWPIPALVTARADVRENGNAPLIVMPHGGPESHDRYGFDWMAQYFAARGYVVLQPQFRGSTGFGYAHNVAGEGEWGGRMQSDLDDGVLHLIDKGLVDAERVCMVGASYGGYAALAAGAFSPDMYKCIAAIAPVSDLRRQIRRARSTRGRNSWVIDYWERQFGAEASEKEILQTISPVFNAEAFTAPVLLIHGEKDTVVHIEQSKVMEKALRKAKKDVEFVKLKGEDHWLTREETRIETLRHLAAFIDEHL
ncbi:MAG: alpha/beta fold hydrolase [Woeseiaceae bacterium]|nr:alpha/beta fold hydrolase [Woeseiaceae bacterium]